MPSCSSDDGFLYRILVDFAFSDGTKFLVFLESLPNMGVALSHDLFYLCFRPSQGSSSYYLSPCIVFKISGAASYNKG